MSSLMDAFQAGGVGMWPTLVLGVVAVGLSVSHAVKPRPEVLPLIIGTGIATLLSGTLAFVTGVMATFGGFDAAAAADISMLAMAGVAESLNAVALALALTMLTALCSGVGSFRAQPVT